MNCILLFGNKIHSSQLDKIVLLLLTLPCSTILWLTLSNCSYLWVILDSFICLDWNVVSANKQPIHWLTQQGSTGLYLILIRITYFLHYLALDLMINLLFSNFLLFHFFALFSCLLAPLFSLLDSFLFLSPYSLLLAHYSFCLDTAQVFAQIVGLVFSFKARKKYGWSYCGSWFY